MIKKIFYLTLCILVSFSVVYGQEKIVKKGAPPQNASQGGIEWEIIESPAWQKVETTLPYTKVSMHVKIADSLLVKGKKGTPLVNINQSENSHQTQNLVTIISDDFEGSFPGTNWHVNGNPTWGKTDYKKNGGSYSVWCARSGTNGQDPRYYNYPNNCNSIMIFGPFDLSDVNWAGFSFLLWLDSESNYDYLSFAVSTNGTDFKGYGLSGSTNNNWIPFGMCLRNVPDLGDVTGRSSVWVALIFTSDGSYTNKGAFVDDFILQKGNVTALDQITSFSAQGTSPWGIAFDGTNLWQSNYTTNRIYKLNTSNGQSLSSFSVSGDPLGLAYEGTYLWIADAYYGKIYKRTTSGSYISSFYAPGSFPTGLTWDGTYLWLCDGATPTVWQLTTTGTIVNSFSAPGSYHTGLGWDGQNLWLADADMDLIYELDTSGNVLDYYLAPGTLPKDLEFQGSDFWLADDNSNRIYKLMGPIIGPNPRASFTISPPSGYMGTAFTVDASSSRDDQTSTSELKVRWDWENDGIYDTDFSTTKTASHQYTSIGQWDIKLQVKDSDANTDSTIRRVSVNDRAPQAFDLISPAHYDTVWTFTPTFTWGSAIDTDPGDTVRYFLRYSKSPWFTSPDTIEAGMDTTVTLADSLQEMSRYYWQVDAVDRYGSITTSSQKWNFLVADLIPPKFTTAILQNPIATEDLDIYAIPNERLDEQGVKVTANNTPIAMSKLYESNNVWVYTGDYELSSSGTLVLIFRGQDTPWGNEGIDTLTIAVQLIKPTAADLIVSIDKRIRLEFPKNAVSQNSFISIFSSEEEKKAEKMLFKKSTELPENMKTIGPVYQIGPSQLSLNNFATLSFSYSEEELNGVDESKLGIYFRDGSHWIYLKSYLDKQDKTITTQIQHLGEYRLLFAPNRSESALPIPKTYRLFQNYPNPFNNNTVIRYTLPQNFSGHVTLQIYNFYGQLVKTLLDKNQKMGYYSIGWDGTNNDGNNVASGVYFYQIQTRLFRVTNKMIFLK